MRWREKYDRMKRWQARLGQRPPVDDILVDNYYAFFECCYHLKDWLKSDTSVDPSVPPIVEGHINNGQWLAICGDIANGSKHLVRQPGKARVDPNARVSARPAVFSGHVFQSTAFQTQDTVIVKVNAREWDAFDVVNECVREWDDFLKPKGLI